MTGPRASSWLSLVALLLWPGAAASQAFQAGRWDVTSTVVELSVPGVPGFVQRMMRGRTSAEHKMLLAGQGIEVLLAPDPKARCTVDSQRAGEGRYGQVLTCPQKQGGSVHIVRSGTYDAAGFAGRASVTGTTPKGALSIVLDQRAARVGS